MRLQADPTVIYGIMGGEKLSRPLTKSDLRIKSIYNTYIINGLPPNPICNPSEAALNAAANPANFKILLLCFKWKRWTFLFHEP